ncbi:MAG: U32 family peptidase [Spirochaetaceae bacterium]|jgi:putative protease|nr:U32 family peptidase [Spirochaetaceae bacterium]
MKTNSPELLAPAGSPEALDAAVAEGADAVYLGLKSFNARMRSANFAYSQFEGALRSLHRMGRRLYVTVNTVFEQREADRVYQLLKYLAAAGPDGIIVQDLGLLLMAREFPQLKIHASTQMNIASARGANVLSKYGVSRVVLARELSLEEIGAIGRLTNVEMEVFVHGALCASVSGLCLFSSYLGGKSANRGLCTQACRRLYHAEGAGANRGDIATEFDEAAPFQAGYYFSPCDLSLIARMPELAEAGVRSFKIEGRMKSAEYVGTVVSAYRRVIDSMESGEDERRRSLEDARSVLQNDFARPKTEFFFSPAAAGTIFRPEQDGGTGISMGTILKVSSSGSELRALVKSGGQITLMPGDSVRFHKADDSRRQAHKLTFAGKSGGAHLISIPEGFEAGDSVYLIQTKSMTRRYPQALPKDLSPFKRQPGREKAPPLPDREKPPSMPDRKNPAAKKQLLPEGIFTALASTEDLYIVQSIKPAGVILPVNRKTIRLLLEEKPLPFKAQEIILALDPWFPQEEERFLAELPEQLEERGYCRYILNNPGHFSLFRNNNGKSRNLLIAGPWLYSFNSWAAAFASTLGARYCITPLENNRQNLEKTFPPRKRGAVFVTLFAWPPLFRIKTGVEGLYGFTSFTGSRDEPFTLVNGNGNSVVIPNQPFSITDKKPFLAEAGFRRFILDFSAGMFNGSFPLKKKLYKEVMNAATEGLPLSGISRFNWKNGFFSEKS